MCHGRQTIGEIIRKDKANCRRADRKKRLKRGGERGKYEAKSKLR